MAIDIQSLMSKSLAAAVSYQNEAEATAQKEALKVVSKKIKEDRLQQELTTNMNGVAAKEAMMQKAVFTLFGQDPAQTTPPSKYNFNFGAQ